MVIHSDSHLMNKTFRRQTRKLGNWNMVGISKNNLRWFRLTGRESRHELLKLHGLCISSNMHYEFPWNVLWKWRDRIYIMHCTRPQEDDVHSITLADSVYYFDWTKFFSFKSLVDDFSLPLIWKTHTWTECKCFILRICFQRRLWKGQTKGMTSIILLRAAVAV